MSAQVCPDINVGRRDSSSRPILVTGSHRSGTTWLGRVLSIGSRVGYLQEPFNPINDQPGHFAHGLGAGSYAWIDEENEARYRQAFARILSFRYADPNRRPLARNWRDAGRRMKHASRLALFRAQKRRPLIKDPFALFAAPWIHARFDCAVVVTIRHPVAFASSVNRIGDDFSFECFTRQPKLMSILPPSHAEQLERAASKRLDIIAQAILLWNVVAFVIDKYEREYSDWIFVRHEDLSRDPVTQFTRLYERLALPLSPHIVETIDALTRAGNPREAQRHYGATPVDSRRNIDNWRNRLSPEVQARVLDGVGSLARRFYSADELRPGPRT